MVGVDKHLVEKLGRNDPCPCGSNRRFQELLYQAAWSSGLGARRLLLGSA
ncbi:MAG: SEC-C metal-binding domain-containing protein [Pseudomonadota bacterium]